MATELYWLDLSVLLTAIIWIAYVIILLVKRGLDTNSTAKIATCARWERRFKSAADTHTVQNLFIFAPLVLIVDTLHAHTSLTALAVIIYFFSRLAHAILFILRISVLTKIAFLGGLIAQMMLVLTIILAKTW